MNERYEVIYLLNGKYIDSIYYNDLCYGINDALYWLKTIAYKVDQIQIYKHGNLVAELNK